MAEAKARQAAPKAKQAASKAKAGAPKPSAGASKAAVLGKRTKAELPAEIFTEPFHESLVHETVVAELGAKRRGTASTLRRSEVAMTSAKAWRQKGTGRARVGALSSPTRRGGGAAFGPSPRRFLSKVNRKARRRALRAVLSVHAARETIAVLEADSLDEPSTKEAAGMLDGWSDARPTLVVLERSEDVARKSFRNIPTVEVIDADQAGVANVLGAASLVVSSAALDVLAERAAPPVKEAA